MGIKPMREIEHEAEALRFRVGRAVLIEALWPLHVIKLG
ncbi:hypothetical protein NRB20_69640 [Nocardia sp. RB20]|uniref:Uncharacterized protein n=1 Tax=Nocardia macrotermitis TaxID=2585198 RepID=A0A7K0DEB6_9NOCA|nr:hypothetical protein [Nocardia macrotermitis]